MQTTKGSVGNTANDARKVSVSLLQSELIDLILFNGANSMSNALKSIRDIALYHSEIPIDEAEKQAMFKLKLLCDGLDRIADEE